MDGRAFLDAARALARGPTEPFWRSAAGRAYYALLHEGAAVLDRWGFPVPPRDSIHTFVRMRLVYPADVGLKKLGDSLEQLSRLRNYADYQLGSPGPFNSTHRAQQAVKLAADAINLLDAIESDPTVRAAAVAAIRAAFAP